MFWIIKINSLVIKGNLIIKLFNDNYKYTSCKKDFDNPFYDNCETNEIFVIFLKIFIKTEQLSNVKCLVLITQ